MTARDDYPTDQTDVVDAIEALENGARYDCCAAWPKPCQYHEGYLDALDHLATQIGLD